MIKDVLSFQSDAFSLEPPVENGVSYDLPLGDDLGLYLKHQLEKIEKWDILDPVREDFGSVLLVYIGKKCFNITIIWACLYDNQDYWLLQFNQAHGCLGFYLPKRDDVTALSRIKTLCHRIVTADTNTFRSVKWLSEAEFKAIYYYMKFL